ncbi:MAG TPA: DUF1223 domain-containing protein [Vicinamibacterales bacterium]|nr:DUF1223 domain-containing protein [Vicinamibacterales bacterium]
MRIVSAIAILLLGFGGVIGPSPAASDQPVPVLVELFAAEGCSTCPPADTLLEAMTTSQPASGVVIVALVEDGLRTEGRAARTRGGRSRTLQSFARW